VKCAIKSAVFLTLVSSSFIGCTKYADISFEEASRQKDPHISRIILVNSIDGVVAKQGKETLFDGKSGSYDEKEQTIGGVSVEGDRVLIPLADVYDVITRSTGLSEDAIQRVSKAKFLRESAMYDWEEYCGRDVQRRDTMLVKPSTVELDTENGMIAVNAAYRSRIEMSHDRVFLQKKKTDALRTAGLVAGIGALAITTAAVIAMASYHSWSWSWD
jgi:hypothetical protein